MSDALQEGIAAYESGDRTQAEKMFQQAVKEAPENAEAWYYLALAQTDLNKRKENLEKALSIDPKHTKAKRELKKVNTTLKAEAAPPPAEKAEAAAPAPKAQTAKAQAAAARAKAEDVAEREFSPEVLQSIPDAPKSISIAGMCAAGVGMVRTSVAVFLARGGLDKVAKEATWWRFWVAVATGSLVSAFLFFLEDLFTGRQNTLGILGIIAAFVVASAAGIIAVPVGARVSYDWVKQPDDKTSLLTHGYLLAIPWLLASIVNAALHALFAILNFSGILYLATPIVGAIIAWYALTIMAKGLTSLYPHKRMWLTAGVMLLVVAIAYFMVYAFYTGVVVGPVAAAF